MRISSNKRLQIRMTMLHGGTLQTESGERWRFAYSERNRVPLRMTQSPSMKRLLLSLGMTQKR